MRGNPLVVAVLVFASVTAVHGQFRDRRLDPDPLASPGIDAGDAPRRFGTLRFDLTIQPGPAEAGNPVTFDVPVVSGLHFENRDQLRWNDTAPAGTVYDVMTGFVHCMREVGGVYCAACLANDLVSPEYVDLSMPSEGEGLYYIVRAQSSDGTHGTYDSTTDPAAREDRDVEVGALDCP